MIRKSSEKYAFKSLPLIVAAIVILFVLIYVTIFTFAKSNMSQENTPNEVEFLEASPGETIEAAESSTEAAVSKNVQVFLAAGKDEVSGLTDVLLLAAFDTANMTLNVIQIPRDTYFRCSDRTYRKINGAVSALGGIDELAGELGRVLGINIDHTVQFSLEAFGELVDLIGGVPVVIPCDMDYDDPYQKLSIHLDAGEHVLDGEAAKQFVRFRSGYIQGDIARVDAQKIFMAAFAQKLVSGVSVLKLPAIIGVMLDDVKTDMNFTDCLTFAQKAMTLKTENIKMLTMSGSDTRTKVDSGAWYYIINRSAARSIVNRYLTPGVPVTDEMFDPDRRFTDSRYPHYDKIYDDTEYEIKEYSADGINKNGIGIGVTDR